MREALKYYKANSERIDSFHENENLTFTAIDVWKLQTIDKTQIHKSTKGRLRNMASRYYVAIINNRPAYVRVSDHWGFFTTRGTWNDEDYEYNSIPHNWELEGGKRRNDGNYAKVSQAGFIYLD